VLPEKLKDDAYRVAVSLKIDAELRKLKAEKKISAADIEKIKGRFAARLARPQQKTLDADLIKAYPFLGKKV
jgi:pyridoxine 5'-phosphate synthase PdxJ